MLFVTNIKQIKTRRLILLLMTFIIIMLMVMIVKYNIYLYLLIIPLLYGAMKLLYKKKVQIIDIFLIATAYGYLSIISYICSFIIKDNMDLYWIAYVINNILLFGILFLLKWIFKAYKLYIHLWNRKPGNKVRSISIRNVSLILLNIFILILDVFITKVTMW
jgi:hypothetical protein